MAKKNGHESTIENRVYLFRDLAAAFLEEHGAGLLSTNARDVARVRRALAEIARASCIVSDTEGLTAEEVAEVMAREPAGGRPPAAPSKRAAKKRRR